MWKLGGVVSRRLSLIAALLMDSRFYYCAFCFHALLSSSAFAATLVVDASGGGEYQTITSALKKAKDGDIVEVRAGRYAEKLSLKRDIRLSGAGSGNTIISGTGYLLNASGLSKGKVSGFTFEVKTLDESSAIHLKDCRKDFVFADNVVQFSGESATEAAVLIERGSPSVQGNRIAGGVHVAEGAVVDLGTNQFESVGNEQGQSAPAVFAAFGLRGLTQFQNESVVGVNVTKTGAKALGEHVRKVFPHAVTVSEGNVDLPPGFWELQVEIEQMAIALGDGPIIEATANMLYELLEDGQRVVLSARNAVSKVDNSPSVVEVNGGYVISYGGIAGGLGRVLGVDPFAEAVKQAIAEGLPLLKSRVVYTLGAMAERKGLEAAKTAGRVQVEAFIKQASNLELIEEARGYLVDIEIDEALSSKDNKVLDALLRKYPAHPRRAEIQGAIAGRKKIVAEKETRQKQEAMSADSKRQADEYAAAKAADTQEAYLKFIEQYPKNPHVPEARARLEELREYFKVTESVSPDNMVDVKKEPKVFGDALMRVAVGTKLPVLGVQGDWVKVETGTGAGYLPESTGKRGTKSEL